MRTWGKALVLLPVLALGLTACGGSSSSAKPGSSSSRSRVTGTITVFAAASLKEAFTTIGGQFERTHPGTTVRFSFGASSDLSVQITQGAPADVFASASPKNMAQVIKTGDASGPKTFVKNVMEIAVPPGNPKHISSVADLAKPGVKVALCQPQVPCGAVAGKVFTNAKVTVKPATLEVDVKSALAKVELNEVDAGVVYVTDVRAAGAKVKGIIIPAAVNASTEYPIAPLRHSRNSAAARAFAAYVLSPAGQQVLGAAGFERL